MVLQAHPEPRSLPEFTFHTDSPAMGFNHRPDIIQAKAKARSGPAAIATVKSLPDPMNLAF
jgi:hypothetical protein